MDILHGKIKPLYFKYLSAAFGSALISSIYGVVDMAMVGQYQGPDGSAALAVVAPVWNVIYSLGLLMGIGGSVLFSMRRGGGKSRGSENQFFTAAVIGSVILAAAAWAGMILFEGPILIFFGANETLLPLAEAYLRPVMYVLPLFLFGQMLAAFIRNDGNPGLATTAVLSGGIFNVFGDYFFVFTCDMGVFGAGLATAIGCGVSVAAMRHHAVGGWENVNAVWEWAKNFDCDMVLFNDNIACKGMLGVHALMEEQARELGLHFIFIEHDLEDSRTVSRQDMRNCVNKYMSVVLNEKPLDPTIVEFDDSMAY